MKHVLLAVTLALTTLLTVPVAHAADSGRWSQARAKTWYAAQRWPIGSNYVPADAINQLEMWQADTFDPRRIDLELGWAQKLGMNTMRVFLHDQLWQQDPEGLQDAHRNLPRHCQPARHQADAGAVRLLLGSGAETRPAASADSRCAQFRMGAGSGRGPGGSGPVPAAGALREGHCRQLCRRQALLAWDVWNEPDNPGGGDYDAREPKNKIALVASCCRRSIAWARSAKPSQPLTSGVWHDDDWSDLAGLNAVERTQLDGVRHHHLSFLRLARSLCEAGAAADRLWPSIDLHRIHGAQCGLDHR